MSTSETKSSFLLHKDSLLILSEMTNEEAGIFMKAIYHYQITGELPELDRYIKLAIMPLINQFNRDNEKSRSGEYHWNWQNGKSSLNKRLRNSTEYKKWQKYVFKRDNYICQHCFGTHEILHAHHIKQFSKFPDLRFDINNGVTLCKNCHNKEHTK